MNHFSRLGLSRISQTHHQPTQETRGFDSSMKATLLKQTRMKPDCERRDEGGDFMHTFFMGRYFIINSQNLLIKVCILRLR